MPSFEVSSAQESDAEVLAQLYHRIHPEIPGTLTSDVRHQSQAFVARREGQLIGLALASQLDYGLGRIGVILELVTSPGADARMVHRSLVDGCQSWLRELGASVVYLVTPPRDWPGWAQGLPPHAEGLRWDWELRSQELHPVPGPNGAPPGPPPPPEKMVWYT
jgi:N-acetylglutamate synthase-like GNAT family acetyltransferase